MFDLFNWNKLDKYTEAIKRKQEGLAQYGGKMVVSGRGNLRIEFETKEGEKAYYTMIRKKAIGDINLEEWVNK